MPTKYYKYVAILVDFYLWTICLKCNENLAALRQYTTINYYTLTPNNTKDISLLVITNLNTSPSQLKNKH